MPLSKAKDRERKQFQPKSNLTEGSQNWETMPLKDIISALPRDIVSYIENVASKYGMREQRLRRAYKYQVWHDENFINGVHKDSKYRQYVEVAR